MSDESGGGNDSYKIGDPPKEVMQQNVKEKGGRGIYFVLFFIIICFAGYVIYKENPEYFGISSTESTKEITPGEASLAAKPEEDNQIQATDVQTSAVQKDEAVKEETTEKSEVSENITPKACPDDHKYIAKKGRCVYQLDVASVVQKRTPTKQCEEGKYLNTVSNKCMEDLEAKKVVKVKPEIKNDGGGDDDFNYAKHVSSNFIGYVTNDEALMKRFKSTDSKCTTLYIAIPKDENPSLYTLTVNLARKGPTGFTDGLLSCTAIVNLEVLCDGKKSCGDKLKLDDTGRSIDHYQPGDPHAVACLTKHVKALRKNLE